MGVIVIGEGIEDFGTASWFARWVIRYCIGEVGERPYLVNFKNQYDWGYNCIYVDQLASADLAEFAGLLHKFVLDFELDAPSYDREKFLAHAQHLSALVDTYVEKRKALGSTGAAE
ncbi:hypothetical protein [Mesorhizobium loti]|uniref:Uncharacterized protein n=1 Tax=Mesorhizobium loti R88b TaxID=935548 RepID=A0A6M7WJE5_RHILI|nr:hypothetical protein [Mesorhizobium loti]QKD04140.1 hypothetical protein EB235_23830 [Mesorhizobium loti R88b]